MEQKCKFDGTPMKLGKALQMTNAYYESWLYGIVSQPFGFPRLVNCLKCPTCGYSKTI